MSGRGGRDFGCWRDASGEGAAAGKASALTSGLSVIWARKPQ